MKLEITEPAQNDIRDIANHSRSEFGERQAEIYIQDIYKKLSMLADFPNLGHRRDDIPDGYKALRAAKEHIAVYRIEGETVYIVHRSYSLQRI